MSTKANVKRIVELVNAIPVCEDIIDAKVMCGKSFIIGKSGEDENATKGRYVPFLYQEWKV